jgi:sugar-specific transcriptional regulator TrmB
LGERTIIREDEIQTLIGLGLTVCQAKIFLFLSNSGNAPAKIISKATKIDRPDVYRVLPKLHDIGLIEKIIDVPAKFAALSMEDAISILYEKKMSREANLKLSAQKLIENYKDRKNLKLTHKDENQFVIIPKGKAIQKKRANAIQNAKESIDAIISYKRYLTTMIDNSCRILEALNRGVKIRHLTETPCEINELPKTTMEIWNHPLFDMRIVTKPLTSLAAIYDKKEIIVSVTPALRLNKSDAFWSDNSSMLEIVQEFFESTWNTGQIREKKQKAVIAQRIIK